MGLVNTEEREEGQRGMDLICVRCEEPNCGRGGARKETAWGNQEVEERIRCEILRSAHRAQGRHPV